MRWPVSPARQRDGDEEGQDAAKPWGSASTSLTLSYFLVDVVLVDYSAGRSRLNTSFFKKLTN